MDKETALRNLHEILKPGDTVYTVLRKVSASGMSRNIDLYAIKAYGPVRLSGYALALGIGSRPRNDGEGITIRGCGMDMGFDLVYTLGRVMWRDGSPCGRDGKPDTDGGYTLKHRWL